MDNWHMLREHGQQTVQEHIEAAERSRRFKHLRTGNSLLTRLRIFTQKENAQEQEQSTLPSKPVVSRGV